MEPCPLTPPAQHRWWIVSRWVWCSGRTHRGLSMCLFEDTSLSLNSGGADIDVEVFGADDHNAVPPSRRAFVTNLCDSLTDTAAAVDPGDQSIGRGHGNWHAKHALLDGGRTPPGPPLAGVPGRPGVLRTNRFSVQAWRRHRRRPRLGFGWRSRQRAAGPQRPVFGRCRVGGNHRGVIPTLPAECRQRLRPGLIAACRHLATGN